MRGWYIAELYHASPPARITLEKITAEHVELYRAIPPPGENIPISRNISHIDDSVTTEEEVEWAVHILRGNRLGGTSRICAENFQ